MSRPTSGHRRPAGPVAGRQQRLDRGPGLDPLLTAPRGQHAAGLVGDDAVGGRVGGSADDHLARLGGGLQPAGGVDDVAHRGDRAAGPQRAHQHLAGVDPDPHADLRSVARASRRSASATVAGAIAAIVCCMRSAARTARSASSSWAIGAPNRATMASPTILSTRPPNSAMSSTSRSNQPSTRFLTFSGSSGSAREV